MTEGKPIWSKNVSRRCLLHSAAYAAGAAAVTATATNALAQAKAKKDAVAYQEMPKGDQWCANCMHFEAPSNCKVVESPISPAGWCNLYVKKG